MVEAIASLAVKKLGNLLTQECSFLLGVKDQVEEMKVEFTRMQCFLKDADRRSHKNEGVRHLIKRVTKVAYRIENIFETCDINVESSKEKRIKTTLKSYLSKHNLGSEIEDIKKAIANITPSLQAYGIKSENEGQSSNDARTNLLRQTFPHDIEEHFVGMQDDIARLVELMTDTDEGHRIISIYGMGGLGKTTLAKKVSNRVDVQNRFESFAWVAVSQQFEAEYVLKDILRQLDTGRGEGMGYGQLVQELHKFQREKKCLVVLDDIWKREHWDAFRPAFANTSVGCKVLLTTRVQEVAEIGTPHKLKFLSEEEGWELLKKKAFSNKNGTDSNPEAEQEKLGKEIVRKCGYLPLAVSVIGGILRKEETIEKWENVKKNIDSYLRYGHGVEDNNQVMQILTLSYDDLPYQLKPCLLYLAYYPEDVEIYLQELYWMWIAEGLILSKDQRLTVSKMEVAERYLSVLASRSLVQVQSKQGDKVPFKSCRLHDLIRDLCVRKCEEEDFLKVIDRRKSKQHNNYVGNAYRLVIYTSSDDGNVYSNILHEANEGTRVFSLRTSQQVSVPEMACGVSEDLGNLRFLRILKFECIDLSNTKVLDKVMQKLIHLRYLSFVDCHLNEVPSSVGELSYLQSFHLNCLALEEVKIPNVFWKLKRLLHFVLFAFNRSELELEFNSGLETLVISFVGQLAIKDLSKLTNLRVFDMVVHDSKNLSLIIDCIESSWCNIRDLTVRIEKGCDFIGTVDGAILFRKLFLCRAIQHLDMRHVSIRELPKYELGMLSDLVDLELYDNHIEKDPMPTLEKLPKLKILWLRDNSFVGEEFICSSTGFPNLKELRLEFLYKLKNWRTDEGAMPILSTVTISHCHKLEMIPTGMKFLKALRNLWILRMLKEFNDRIRIVDGKEGVDLHKVRHVPSIVFQSELNVDITRQFWRRVRETVA